MEFLSNWWDVLIFILLSILYIAANVEMARGLKSDQSLQHLDQKQLGATILTSASSAGITAVSILIPASLLIVQMGFVSAKPLPFGVLDNVFRASIWFLTSLVMGLYLMWINGLQSQFRNVATNLQIVTAFGIQLIALFIGVVRLIIGIHNAVYT